MHTNPNTSLERSSRRRYRRTRLQQAILGGLYAAGVVTVALMAPNALQVFGITTKKTYPNSRSRNYRQLLYRLQKRNWIKVEKSGRDARVSLTKAGRKVTEQLYGYHLRLQKQKHWDGKWRMVLFDINEHQKPAREQFRQTIQSLGLRRLQNSVWITPHPCEDLIDLLRTDLRLGRGVMYMVAEEIQGADKLKKEFGLNK